MQRLALLVPALFLLSACQSNAPKAAVSANEGARASMLDTLKSLAGTWEMTAPDGKKLVTEFQVTANGSAVREIMFPGAGAHEMTNMYSLDGDSMVVTHYCAMGNQPHMRAQGLHDGKLEFHMESVGDLKTPDQMYMGALTIEPVDHDHLKEHWRSFSGTQALADASDFEFTRRK